MRSRLARLGMVVGTAIAASALMSGPAGASTPEVFGANANGAALNLSIGGTNLTGGLSSANLKSNPTSSAEGVGIFTPGQVQDFKTSATLNTTQAKPNACLQTLPALPGPLGALSLSLACASSTSSVTGRPPVPNAEATGLIAHLGVANVGSIPQLASGLQQLGDGLKQVPQLGPIADEIVSSIATGQILDANIGPSQSSTTTTPKAVVSKATAQGSVIKLFSLVPSAGTNGTTAAPAVSLGPLVTITVGDANAAATYHRDTGKSDGTNDAALVRVSLNLPGQAPQTFSVVPGQDQSFPPAGSGSPTLLTVKVGAGKTTTNPDGSVSSVADALSLAVLPGQAPGGKDVLDLQLAHADASAGGALPTVTPPPHPPTLPFTGEHPWIPYAGLGFLGGALGLGFLAFRGGVRLRRS